VDQRGAQDDQQAGLRFCTALARVAAVSVVAADALQYVNESSLPDGYIDDYEGNVTRLRDGPEHG
jgi:hypothetical protein